jgi:hypothetical protein
MATVPATSTKSTKQSDSSSSRSVALGETSCRSKGGASRRRKTTEVLKADSRVQISVLNCVSTISRQQQESSAAIDYSADFSRQM